MHHTILFVQCTEPSSFGTDDVVPRAFGTLGMITNGSWHDFGERDVCGVNLVCLKLVYKVWIRLAFRMMFQYELNYSSTDPTCHCESSINEPVLRTHRI